MTLVVGMSTEVVHRYVIELRFDFGHVYWDRAGRIAKEILGLEGWDFEQIDIHHCRLSRRDLNVVFNFGPGKLDLSQTQSSEVAELMPAGQFGSMAEELAEIVVRHLELDTFPRIGFRTWHLYPARDRQESFVILQNLDLFRHNESTMNALGDPSELSYRVVVERQEHMLRIALAPFEQAIDLPPSILRAAKTKARDHRGDKQARKALIDKLKAERMIQNYPQFGVLLDLDAYIEDPPFPDDLSVSDFVANAVADFKTVKQSVLKKLQ